MPKKREYYSSHRNRPPSKRKRGRPKLPKSKSKLKAKPLGKKALKALAQQEQLIKQQQAQQRLEQALLNFWK